MKFSQVLRFSCIFLEFSDIFEIFEILHGLLLTEKINQKKKKRNKMRLRRVPSMPWKVHCQADFKNGFLRVSEVHKLTKRKKLGCFTYRKSPSMIWKAAQTPSRSDLLWSHRQGYCWVCYTSCEASYDGVCCKVAPTIEDEFVRVILR